MLETYEKNSKKKLMALLVSIAVIAGSVVFADHLKSSGALHSMVAQTSSTTNTFAKAVAVSPTTTNTTTSAVTTATSSGYKDGTYTASSDYYVPHGNENIQVRVTLSGTTITGISITNSENDRDSARYQEDFASVYKSYVVGKNISSLRLGIVAGASDTTQGFNDALSQIASKAQA